MVDFPTISKHYPPFPDYLDFQGLRAIGLDHLQQLASDLWTDYNLHDPGVTILEVLCYAVTDLGYRNTLDIQDLLALNPKDSTRQENNFFTPNEILTCNPVTILDWRKRLIDIPGVRNAWIEKVTEVGTAISAAEVEALLTGRDAAAHPHLVRPALYANCTTEQLQFGYPDLPDRLYHRLNPRGLYDVCLDLEPEPHKDACGVVQRSRGNILEAVRSVLCQYRNLGEDFRDLIVLGEEAIAVCADIELTAAADPEDVLVAIYVAVQAFLAPRVTFYTLQELLARGKTTAEIFAGRPAADLVDPATAAPDSDCPTAPDDDAPSYPSHGFIDVDELKALTRLTEIHTSDLYQVIMDVPGVAAIKKLSLVNYINGLRQSEGHPWCLKLTDKHRPVLGVEQSTITFFKGDLPFKANSAEVKQRYQEQQAAYIKAQKEPSELNLPVPRGNYYDLADHYSIHHDFPLTYGISEDGLPATVPLQRKAQAKQLKGYLIFFDQLLANYLAQLSHVRDLFSWETEADRTPTAPHRDRRRTYFTQGLTNVPGGDEILKNFHRCPGSDLPGAAPIDYTAYLDFITESPETYTQRRHQFLDHLLARFAETFTDYVLLNYRLQDGRRRPESDIIDDKAQFLQDYPVLGRDRFRAFNYCRCGEVWDTDNVSGFKKRVSRLLGIDDFRRRALSPYRVVLDPGGYQLVLQKASSLTSETAAIDGIDVSATVVDADPAAIRFTSRDLYRTESEAAVAQTALQQAALVPDRYRRLAYRAFHHYGWELWAGGRAIATVDPFDRNPAQTEAILDDLLATLRSRQVPLPLALVDALTTAVAAITPTDITIEDRAIALVLTTPITEADNNVEANGEAIAALLTALQSACLAAEVDEVLITSAFAAPIVLAIEQPDAPFVQLHIVVQGAASGASDDSAPAYTLRHPVLVTTVDFSAVGPAPQTAHIEVQTAAPSEEQPFADFATQLVAPETAMLIRLGSDESDRWTLHLHLPTTRESPSLEAFPPLSVLRDRLAIALSDEAPVETALTFPRLTLTADADNFLTFELLLPPAIATHDSLSFTSAQRHPAEAVAKAVAFQTLTVLADRDRYHPLTVRREDGTPENFTYYGYGILDAEGQLLAESSDRFATPQDRDLHLQRWLTCLLANQNQFRVEPATECFFVELRDRAGAEIWLLGTVGVASHAAALTQQTLLLTTGQDRDAYTLTEVTDGDETIYSFELRVGDRLLARHPAIYLAPERADQSRYATALERDLWLDALLYYLTQPEPTAFISGEAGTYQATLLSRTGAPWLITYHSYATRTLAEIAYQRLLYLASDPVYFQILNDLEGEQPYGFSLIDRRGRTFATHPGSYPTACARDLAIRTIINDVNQDLVLQFSEREGSVYIDLLDQAETVLLAGDIPHESEAAAAAATEPLLQQAREANHYQLLDDGEGDCPYGFALVVGEERLATHPTYYALVSERDQALQAVISNVIDDDPARAIDGVEGRFSYGLVDVLAVAVVFDEDEEDAVSGEGDGETDSTAIDPSEEAAETSTVTAAESAADDDILVPIGPLLLTSAVLYPDPDAACQGFDTLVGLGADAAHYHRLDDLPGPNSYSFEICDESGEVIARPQIAEGEIIGFSTASEREAAIAKILYYLAQPENQVEITNPEGAFFAELYDDQHQLIWSGQRTQPSPEAAETEAGLIRQLAGMPAAAAATDPCPYQLRRSLGNCPYTFNLVMDDDVSAAAAESERMLVARHPRFYDREATRDRAIQQLRLRFSDNLADFIETPTVEIDGETRYRFALPAADFCACQGCDAEQQERFATGSLLGPPPDPEANPTQPVTYATAAEARDRFREALSFASDRNHFFEIYDNEDCLKTPNAQPFRFELKDSGERPAKAEDPTIATSARTYRSRAEMWAVIHFLQQLAQGFTFTVATPGTHCGYYFYLDLPLPEDGAPAALRSLQRYPSATRAWAAAGAFAENLRFLSRYLEAGTIDGTSYGFAISDATGNPQAVTPAELEPLAVFRALNDLADRVRLIATEGEAPGYQFQLVEPLEDGTDRGWLQGLAVHADEASAATQFYRDVLGRLLEPGAIAPYDIPSGFSFHIILPPEEGEASPAVIARHPAPDNFDAYQFYPTAEARDRAINQLVTFIHTLGLDVQTVPVEPAFVGEIVDADDTVLLRTTRPAPTGDRNPDQQRANAWDDSDTIIELAQDRDAIRLIDDEDGTCFLSWELTSRSHYPVLATPVAHYSSEAERVAAIATLQARLNDEGFHVLEHILLRPQQLLPPPRPCDPTAPEPDTGDESVDETEPSPEGVEENSSASALRERLLPIPLKQSDCEAAEEQGIELCRTSYDPYSFWVSVVLPYWPERFRDMNFRRFVERTLRLEAPAHIALKICWVDAQQMSQFDQAYRSWVEQFALNACEGAACDLPGSLADLIDILTRLETVYPQGTLHDCEASDPDDNPIILNQTALGTAEDT